MNRSTLVIGCSASLGLLLAPSALGGGPDVSPQVRIGDTGSISSNETTASASDANPSDIIAGWNDYRPDGTIRSGFALSLDGGQTWASFILRPPAQNRTSVEGDPMTAFDPRTGAIWAGAIAFAGNGGLYVARKDVGDANFQPSVLARAGFVDKCWMAAGIRPGNPNSTRLYIAYNEGIIWSDDMGQTWTSPRGLGSGIGYLPRVGPNGEIYVAYWDFGAGNRLARSLDGGTTFSTHTIATRMDVWGTQDGSRFPGNFRVPPLVTLDVDENTGHLYATYFDTTNIVNGQRNVDIYFTKSTNQGTTWSTPVVINGDNDPPGDQFFSWIESDSAGRLHVVCLDSRHTVQNDNQSNGFFDAYYLVSEDDGATWQEFRLTPSPWNSANTGIGGFIGDYLGMAVGGDTVYPVYPDTRGGLAEIYTNVISFSGAPADVNAFDIITGTLLSGTVNDLIASDNSHVRVRSGFGATLAEAHLMQMVVHASTAEPSPNSIDITIESRIDEPAGTLVVGLRNWSTNAFETVGAFGLNSTDQTFHVDNATAANRVNGSGEIDILLKQVVFAPFIAFDFESLIDLVELSVN